MSSERALDSRTARTELSRRRDEERIEAARERLRTEPQAALAVADEILTRTSEDSEQERRFRARVLELRGCALREGDEIGPALTALNQARRLISGDQPVRHAEILGSLSATYEKLGDLEAALQSAMAALEYAQQTGDEILIASAETSVAIGLSRCGDIEGGLAHYQRVITYLRASGNTRRALAPLNNMGINLKNLGRFDEALVCQQEAIRYADELSLATGAIVRSNMGETLWKLGRVDEAIDVLATAIEMAREAGAVEPGVNARVVYGRVLASAGRADEAVDVLHQALRAIERSGSHNNEAEAHLALCEILKRSGDHEAALHHYEAFHRAERVVLSAEAQQTAAVSKVRLGLAEARHAAELAQIRSVEMARAYEELRLLHAELEETHAEKTRQLVLMDQERHTDPLTGLANRRALDEGLRDTIAAAAAHDEHVCVAMCDLDRFKDLNDGYGHPTGDLVLRQVGALLGAGCRADDLVARYGGEEFCIVFRHTLLSEAVTLAERLRLQIEQFDWRAVADGLRVTVSVGVAELSPSADSGLLIASADAWLYAAKRDGRNRVACVETTDVG